MNRLPSNLVGREVFLIPVDGCGELEGECPLAREDYLMLRIGPWEYTVEAEAIAAIGVNREDKA
jgi:hypothetical protein